ncbi:hypothetical protein THAOC_37348 [Thalassiosira oceanica]|uniref:Secreted protein n=1 Tax=Thalassiosira oceanica TaxID=159749 RepID=K0QYY4_THAOC|nr:hypothetical protein THAOC_37348 [Thalassiosira oceanica]|eukprot:EJK44140.1 hypothetical protein THAOC_37348 [Thalassiosira oceanica]
MVAVAAVMARAPLLVRTLLVGPVSRPCQSARFLRPPGWRLRTFPALGRERRQDHTRRRRKFVWWVAQVLPYSAVSYGGRKVVRTAKAT